MKRARAETIPRRNRGRPGAAELPEEAVEKIAGHALLRLRAPGGRFVVLAARELMGA